MQPPLMVDPDPPALEHSRAHQDDESVLRTLMWCERQEGANARRREAMCRSLIAEGQERLAGRLSRDAWLARAAHVLWLERYASAVRRLVLERGVWPPLSLLLGMEAVLVDQALVAVRDEREPDLLWESIAERHGIEVTASRRAEYLRNARALEAQTLAWIEKHTGRQPFFADLRALAESRPPPRSPGRAQQRARPFSPVHLLGDPVDRALFRRPDEERDGWISCGLAAVDLAIPQRRVHLLRKERRRHLAHARPFPALDEDEERVRALIRAVAQQHLAPQSLHSSERRAPHSRSRRALKHPMKCAEGKIVARLKYRGDCPDMAETWARFRTEFDEDHDVSELELWDVDGTEVLWMPADQFGKAMYDDVPTSWIRGDNPEHIALLGRLDAGLRRGS